MKIDLRWLIVFALMTLLTAFNLTPRYIGNLGTALIAGALTTGALFGCIVLHELAHSIIARREGVEVIDIVLHPFGGLARFRREPDSPRAELRIAIAGPIASLVLAIAFGLMMAAAGSIGNEPLTVLLFLLALWNFMLGVFNLFPGYPLDGGRVLRAYLWRRGTDLNEATVITGRFGMVIGGVLIVFGAIIALFRGDLFSGFWTILVGLFLFDSARKIILEVRDLENLRVEDVMQLAATAVPEMNVLEFVNTVLPLHRRTVFLIARDRQFYGVLLLEDLKRFEREVWHTIRLQDAMRPVEPDYFVESGAPFGEARILMRENGINAVGVIDSNGHLVGFLQRGRVRMRS